MRIALKPCLLIGYLLVWMPLTMEGRCTANDDSGSTSHEDDDLPAGTPPINFTMKTAGGTQFWTDHLHRGGYRVQQHALTGHWRLLDPDNHRKGWGTRSHCERLLDTLCPPEPSDSPKHVVVLLHGLMRSRGSMRSLETKLLEASCDEVIRFSYASTRAPIAKHAAALRSVLQSQPANTQFSFVGHSMGNIIVRHVLGDLQNEDPAGLKDRCRSMVMLGPPNQGAMIARRLAKTGLFGLVSGQGALELGPKWEDLEKKLAVPDFPFVIVAGDLSHNPIKNPLVSGSNDLVVRVEEANLDGAEWIETVPVGHTFLMQNVEVQKLTVDFIQKH